jgi:hypothetical protein
MNHDGVDETIDRCHRALVTLLNGNVKPWRELFSHGDDVTLGNPFGPFVRGIDDVMSAATAAADRYGDGEIVGFDRVATYVGEDLACIVEVERFRAARTHTGPQWPWAVENSFAVAERVGCGRQRVGRRRDRRGNGPLSHAGHRAR